ncbi:MAG: S1 RNA-binding domain-containing protein [Oligoflexia bacterium]|nr:S1 RNA-binding domain-containing protein [Oligoflexia bacterium]
MAQFPKQDDAPTTRRTTIRRSAEVDKTGDGAPIEAAGTQLAADQAKEIASAKQAAQEAREAREAREAQEAQAAASSMAEAVRPSLDGDALLAELDGFDQDAFAALLAQGSPVDLEVGDEVTGTVVRITKDTIFVDIGGKSEAWLPHAELDNDQPLTVGGALTAWVLSAGGQGVRLTLHLSAAAGLEALETAMQAEIPVDGRVESRNAGGYVVAMGALRAFCPISHIDRIPDLDLDSYIGRTLSFRVLELKGRDLVVSHRVIADQLAEQQAAKLWTTLQPGDQLKGVVTGEKPYGVFVDVGGITGLVHKTELGWDEHQVAPPRGTRVTVRVVQVDIQAGRVSLSMKDQALDPWTRVGTDILVGQVYPGTVMRLTDFGAFIQILPGLQGLAHISTLADHRIESPSDVLSVGQQVPVRVLSVDRERERIELGVRQASEDWSGKVSTATSGPAHRSQGGSLGTLADLMGGIKLKG